ncbi:MAG: helix-turn-helix transcriptional regulator [Akkermansia sp.]|nr:helix-turn-helix transcriptional regulator [Akkermansia sp.]
MDSIDKINMFLAQKGMSGAELERLIGVSNSVYSQWNTKTTRPSNKNLVKIAKALAVDVADLLPDKEEKPRTGKKEKPSTENGERLFSYSDLEILDAIKRADPKDLKAIRVILGIE